MTSFDIKKEDLPKGMTEAEFEKITEKERKKIDAMLGRLVKPHSKKSREVTDKDIKRVIEEVKVLYELCYLPTGKYKGAYAMAHSQIDDKDPLSLFVTASRKIIINPVITRHSGYTVKSKEGCVTFPDKEQIIVQRWHKIELDFVTIMTDPDDSTKFRLSSIMHGSLSGPEAFCFQHEISHGLAEYIYPIEEKII